MTQEQPILKKRYFGSGLGRVFLFAIRSGIVAMLIATVFVAVFWNRGDQMSEYESQAIAVVAMQNDVTQRWNAFVDVFNASSVESQSEHVVLFTDSLDSVDVLITDSQAVINKWSELDVPDEHVNSYEVGFEALLAMQDGLILFAEYFQNSVDTLVSDQIRADDAAEKLVHASELWKTAAEIAATEG